MSEKETQETAARLYFWLKDCADELESQPELTEADKRHLLKLKAAGIVTKDRIQRRRAALLGGRA